MSKKKWELLCDTSGDRFQFMTDTTVLLGGIHELNQTDGHVCSQWRRATIEIVVYNDPD